MKKGERMSVITFIQNNYIGIQFVQYSTNALWCRMSACINDTSKEVPNDRVLHQILSEQHLCYNQKRSANLSPL